MMTTVRGALKSWTVWFNTLAGMAVVSLPTMMETFPQLEGYLSHKTYHFAMGALVAANILLRVKTSVSLARKGAPQ
jgi:cytochrome b561